MTHKEISKATNVIFRHYSSFYNYKMCKPLRMDMRYNFSKLVKRLEKTIKIDKDLIFSKKKERLERKNYKFENILDNKLLNDFKRNGNGMIVYDDRLYVAGRNHWAKNEQDFKVLQVLKKWYSRKNNN